MFPLLLAAVVIPLGFTHAPTLETASTYVAGHQASVVCTTSSSAWEQAKAEHQLETTNAWGFYDWVTGLIYIHPNGCRILKAEAAGRKLADPLTLQAGFALTLTHESIHASGQHDEGITECNAIHQLPRVLTKFFHVKAGKQLRTWMAAAWEVHRSEPPEYRTMC